MSFEVKSGALSKCWTGLDNPGTDLKKLVHWRRHELGENGVASEDGQGQEAKIIIGEQSVRIFDPYDNTESDEDDGDAA